jgi:hypothetical protein
MGHGPPSLVTYRARQGSSRRLIDKLILRTGWEHGSAMILLDLYATSAPYFGESSVAGEFQVSSGGTVTVSLKNGE